MRILRTHSNNSERPGYEARKNVKNVIEGNIDTIKPPVKTCHVPPAWRGERDEKGAMARPTTVKTLLRTVSVAAGGETKQGELKKNTGAKTRETKVKTLRQAAIVAGEGKTKGENQHEMERWHNPQPREVGKCLAENA